MKKAAIIFLLAVLSSPALPAETIANVTGRNGLVLIIDRGAMDGVELGMKGIVKALYKELGGEYTINIGNFIVSRVLERAAEATMEIGKGLNPDDARYVVFEKELLPAASPPAPIVVTQNADWHLDQGDRAVDAGDVSAALAHYEKALALEPGNLVAKEKCSETRKAIARAERGAKFNDYLKKSDAHYEKSDVKFAFLYLVEALRLYPEGRDDVRSRLMAMERESPQELAAILEEKAGELGDIRPQIDSLLSKPPEPGTKDPTGEVTKPQADAGKKSEKTATPPQPEAAAEPFLQKIKGKADKAWRNDLGYWEALFHGNISMVYIPAGEATIGSPAREGDDDEHPAHKLFLEGYWIGKTEVTFEQYDRFCDATDRPRVSDEGWGRGTRPVIYVSWHDAAAYCAWLEEQTGLRFRLPSEAEWEKAARFRYPWGGAPPDSSLANFNKDHMMTRPVGSYPKGASPFGILDMAGNVWEWVQDWYDAGFYGNTPHESPQGPESGSEKVVRGGSWANGAALVRSANRSSEKPESALNILGFRLALDGK